jgi:hypothetical protein
MGRQSVTDSDDLNWKVNRDREGADLPLTNIPTLFDEQTATTSMKSSPRCCSVTSLGLSMAGYPRKRSRANSMGSAQEVVPDETLELREQAPVP